MEKKWLMLALAGALCAVLVLGIALLVHQDKNKTALDTEARRLTQSQAENERLRQDQATAETERDSLYHPLCAGTGLSHHQSRRRNMKRTWC